MQVKKRNGTIEDFKMDKIRLTLGRVSDELSMPFTGADLKMLTDIIEKDIRDTKKEVIESVEIYKIVVSNLKGRGFTRIAQAYEDFEKRFK